ncbi:hypothetical protein [Thalassospira xiamenensis]|uniref:hypothetical protein n=1 Tax=Thalassospira xiamenensis TaxID=220697 RepID=UPI000DEDC2C4|nr:hypothetical protein [Thalassospira xiamenensis]RCK40216.1 hypothetical protein TH24_09640 [Thalassospira xiamenensis]
MSDEVAFKAQPLNNEDISIIELDGIFLTENDAALRDKVNQKINKTSRIGLTIYKKDEIEILYYKYHVIIEIQTESLDVIQRRAPIICSTSSSKTIESPEILLNHIKTFALNIDRKLLPGNEQIIQALKSIKKHAGKPKKGLADMIIDFIKKIISSFKKTK